MRINLLDPTLREKLTRNEKIGRVAIGFVTGFLSSMSGTAGPVVLMPITLLLKWDIIDALGAAMVSEESQAMTALSEGRESKQPCRVGGPLLQT
eukprot:7117488-Prorocentrum_lima.AAC.1